jgi:hypothetical protein
MRHELGADGVLKNLRLTFNWDETVTVEKNDFNTWFEHILRFYQVLQEPLVKNEGTFEDISTLATTDDAPKKNISFRFESHCWRANDSALASDLKILLDQKAGNV